MKKVKVGELADEIMNELNEYADVITDDMKAAIRKAGNKVKTEISENAPKDTGAYAKSWAVKKTGETSNSLHLTVYSKTRYQLSHLLENGHALRNGGRVAARPHIAPAEKEGIKLLEESIKRAIRR